ncbi:MAG TPA: FecR family protein [Terracidiphilus sp.]|nr:FecR family protein [Terracidiphilus sp.]
MRRCIRQLSGGVAVALFGAATLFLASPLRAQDATQQDAGQSDRAVRLSYVDGQVGLSLNNTVLASQALANTPLFEGTRITTGDDGRAEVQFEDGSVARISPNSSLTLTVLRQTGGATDTVVTLDSGLGYFELQAAGSGNPMRVRFGNSQATATGFTVLRIDMDNPPGEFAVFSGNAHLESENVVSLDMHGGQSVQLNAENPASYQLSETIESNSWDAWNSDRDEALTSQEDDRTAATSSEPNSSNPAWSDLDANGNWYNVPGQGYVWSPYEAAGAGWDPYGCGSWMWMPGYGYGWVSCESWGYLPFQFGMWNYYNGFGWGWSPGWGGTWWNTGNWAYNIGTRPINYIPPARPRGGPARPHGGSPVHVTGGQFQPYPVVAVNRLHEIGRGAPIRVHNRPATIAGERVEPLQRLEPRPRYEHLPPAGISRPAFGYNGATATHAPAGTPQRPVYGAFNGAVSGGRTAAPPRAYGNPARSPSFYGNAPRPSAPGNVRGPSFSRPSGGGAHPNFGGRPASPSFGGGGFHPSGGGGAPHPSGGHPRN